MDDGGFDEEGLPDKGEGEGVVEWGSGPDGVRFEAGVVEVDPFAAIGVGAVLEDQREVGEPGGLVGVWR